MARILVVEDNETNLDLIAYLLEAFGHIVLIAHDGLEGLEVTRHETLDLALIDMNMPRMDGYELARQLKNDPALRSIPLVAITALAMVGDQDKVLAAGFDGYIAKPIDPETFIPAVERYLVARPQTAANTATILVVDDDRANREFLITLLGYRGHRLVEATDGLEALELVRVEQPDLVIADIVMPTMDGYEFVRQLRIDPALASTKVMFYTATYLKQEAESLALSCGVSHILVKPSDPEKILQMVDTALGLTAPPPPPPPLETFNRKHLQLLTNKLSQQTNLLTAAHDRLAALIELSQQLVLEHDPHRILEKFCHAAREIIGAKYAAIGVLNGEESKLRHFLTSGLDRETATRLGYPPANQGLLNQLLAEGRPLRLRDLTGDPEAMGLASFEGAPYHPLIHSFLGAPVASPTQLYGWLYLGNKIGAEEFSEEDERIITTLVAQVAVAYENSSRYYEIQHHADKLEQEINERKRLQEQLLQAQKMQAVGQLAGGVAHDFNNILIVIIGYSELLLQSDLTDQEAIRLYLHEIKKSGERAATLTRQLLAFSRKQVLQPEVLDLNEMIAGIEDMLRRLIGEHIDLTPALTPELGRVKADPGQLQQVILNLAVNARDAMAQGGKLIIETANVELDETYTCQYLEVAPGPYVLLAVSDTGIGMDAETQARIFEPFFTTKEVGKGTGLGLAMSYGIIKQSGGHIAVYSEPGRGTTFKVYLPRMSEPDAGSEPIPTATESYEGSEVVLVVEDEASVRELVYRVLTQKNYMVLQAKDGPEALQLCRQHTGPLHLLLTDVVMPGGINGYELAGQIRFLYPGLKVVYMSGYTDHAILQHGILEPGAAFLQKPFAPDSLTRKIFEVLRKP